MIKTLSQWEDLAEKLSFSTHHIIDGERVKSEESMAAINPANGEVLAQISKGGEIEIDRAVQAARQAFDYGPWPKMAPSERKKIMMNFAQKIRENRDELALLVSLEMGKPIQDSWGIELSALINTIEWYGELADKIYDESPHVAADALALITRQAIGVVGVVTPWNFPLTLTGWKIAPALAVGCTLVIKPAELSSLSLLRLGEIALEAGIPAGVINIVTGLGSEAGRALGLHPGVDALTFTGSTKTGREFMRYSADSNLKHIWLELGGKSANIIFADLPDLESAAQMAAWGVRFNSGQMCTAPTRLLIQESVHEEFTDRLCEILAEVKIGNPLDPKVEMGPIASAHQMETIQMHLDSARSRGVAEKLKSYRSEEAGNWLSPAVFTNVASNDPLAQEEIFGPVLSVIPFSSDEEAVQIANNSIYGLAAGIWTSNLSRAHQISRKIKAGTVWVNCYEEGDLTVPFGGMKQSGNGRDKSIHALEKYLEMKTTWIQL